MSPSEDDLRAALRDGEGPTLDPDAVLALGRTYAAGHRSSLWVAASGALVAAAVVTIGAVALSGGGASPTAEGPERGLASHASGWFSYGPTMRGAEPVGSGPGSTVSAAPGAVTPSTAIGTPSAANCPTEPPMTPGGIVAEPSREDSGPLLPSTADSVTVCGYNDGTATSLVLTGADAKTLIDSVNDTASPSPEANTPACPMYRAADPLILAIVAGGRTVWTSVGDPPCATTVTNGTASHTGWSPPASLATRINALR